MLEDAVSQEPVLCVQIPPETFESMTDRELMYLFEVGD
jgi:hypothetical protein